MRRLLRRLPFLVGLLLGLGSALAVAAERPTLFHTPPPQARPGEPLVVEGMLVRGERVDKLVLHFRGPSQPYQSVPMDSVYGDLFRGAIPADKVALPGVEYYVEGITDDGSKVPLFMSEARPARVLVVPGAPRPPKPKEPPPEAVASHPESKPPESKPPESKPPEPKPPESKPPSEKAPEPRVAERTPAESRPAPERTPPEPRPSERAVAEAKPPPERPAPSEKAPPERTPPEPKSSPSRRPPEPKPAEPKPPPPVERDEFGEPVVRAPASEPERRAKPMSELEEELSLYSAEDRSAIAPRQEQKEARTPEFSVTVTREEMVAMGARGVFDVLSLLPGLSISRDVSGFYRTAVRSSRSAPQVLFFLNGHLLNNFYDGRALANLPVENLERIEVILGPGPAQYGMGAFDAVVNIFTRREEGLQAAVAGGTFTTFDGHVTALKPLGGLKLFGDVDVLGQAGSSRRVDQDSLGQETLAQGYREDPLDPAGFTKDDRLLLNVGAGLSYESEGVGKLTLSTRFMGEDRAALIGLFDTLGNDSRLKWQVFGADLAYELVLTPKATGRARFFFDDQYTDRVYQLSPGAVPPSLGRPGIPGFTTASSLADAAPDQIFPAGVREAFRAGTRTFGLDVAGDVALAESNRLQVGVAAQEQVLYAYEHLTNYFPGADGTLRLNPNGELRTPEGMFGIPGEAGYRLSLALYAQDQWSLLPNLTATFGFRVEGIQLPTSTTADRKSATTALVPNYAPRVGVTYEVTPALVLKASYSRATRPPTLQELYESVPSNSFTQGRFVGNPELLSPTMDLVQLGADLVQVSGEARVRLRGNVFYQNVTNPIVAVDTSGNIVPLSNRTQPIRVVGAEGEARLDVSRRTRAWLNASFFRAQDTQSRSSFQLLTDTPQARLNTGLSMPLGEWLNFDLTVELGAERRNNSRSALEALRRFRLPAYNIVTAQLRTETVAERFSFALVCKNLFETDLEDDAYRPDRMPGGVPREGLSAFLTVRVSL